MTKSEVVSKIAAKASLSKASAEKALNAFTKSVMEAVKKGDKVNLTGFGAFSSSKRAAREGRNPRTGQPIKIRASKVPKFRPGKGFKDFIR